MGRRRHVRAKERKEKREISRWYLWPARDSTSQSTHLSFSFVLLASSSSSFFIHTHRQTPKDVEEIAYIYNIKMLRSDRVRCTALLRPSISGSVAICLAFFLKPQVCLVFSPGPSQIVCDTLGHDALWFISALFLSGPGCCCCPYLAIKHVLSNWNAA